MNAERSVDPSLFALGRQTPAAWADVAASDLLALLADHAHCELKAAASAMTLLKRNPKVAGLALRLMPLVREETEHLHRVLRELDARGRGIGFDEPNPYAAGLLAHARSTSRDGRGYLDALLVSALIEMRSHERFLRLRACDATSPLHRLYDALGEAEARHGTLFVALALEAHDAHEVRARFDELARVEGDLLADLAPGPRIHSGWRGL